jgi:hyperosmotically inducible protein
LKVNTFKNSLAAVFAAILIGIAPAALVAKPATAPDSASTAPANTQLAKEVRHRLLMLPYYGVFDNLAYSIDGSKMTLYGQVVRPSTRSDAERSISKINGVSEVVNKIEVLPLSSFDDSIRARTYREIARTGGLYRYLMGANPSLHIIVNNGHVTLTGMVGNKMDQQLAYIAASRVFGSFSVTNELQVDGDNRAR